VTGEHGEFWDLQAKEKQKAQATAPQILLYTGTPERCEGKGGRFSWKGTFELISTKRCLRNIGSWTSPNHVFYWLDDRGVRGSPPSDSAILEARWLHFLRFQKQIRKIIALTFLTFRQGNPLNWKGTFAPLAPPDKGQRGRLPLLPPPPPPPPPSSGVPGYTKCFRPAANVLLDEGFLKHAVMHEATGAKTANNRMLHIVIDCLFCFIYLYKLI
jgi:hypothetical protein